MLKFLYLLSTISLSIIIILLPFFTLLFSQTLYHYEFDKLGVYDGENNQKIEDSLSSLFSFFLYKSNTISNYNENEISHMKDVRRIFFVLELLLIISIVYLIFYLIYFKKIIKNQKQSFTQILKPILKQSSIFTLIFILILILLSINFEQTFAAFHPIFFPQGNYTFDPSISFMKFMLPDRFFFDFLITTLSISFVVSIFILISALYSTTKKRIKSNLVYNTTKIL